MKRIIDGLKNGSTIAVQSLLTIVLAVALLVSPVFQTSSAQATPQVTGDRATDKMIQKIQQDAEDLGDSPDRPIGQTGLKNIKKLGENIKETVDLNVRQKGAIYNPNEDNKIEALKQAQKETERNAK
ncbi:hypothetical protein ACKFKG_08435 [Phormidesmis sp. 146-35]